jgi:hypothetical protein
MKSSWYKSSEPNQGRDSLKEPVIFMKSLAKNQQFGRRILDWFLNFLRTAVTCQNQILRYFENHGYISELVDLIFFENQGVHIFKNHQLSVSISDNRPTWTFQTL